MPCGMRGVPTVMNKPITRDIEFKKPTPPTEGGELGFLKFYPQKDATL